MIFYDEVTASDVSATVGTIMVKKKTETIECDMCGAVNAVTHHIRSPAPDPRNIHVDLCVECGKPLVFIASHGRQADDKPPRRVRATELYVQEPPPVTT